MRTCKIKPSLGECRMCISAANFANSTTPCLTCSSKNEVYELLEVGESSAVGSYAIVVKNGKPDLVPLHRVYDIETVEED